MNIFISGGCKNGIFILRHKPQKRQRRLIHHIINRQPETAEPSEWYRFTAYASMLILTGMVLAGYWMVTGGIGG